MRIDFPSDRPRRAEALRCLFADHPDPEKRVAEALELLDAGEIDLSGLAGIWMGEHPVAAGLLCSIPDGTAFAWPPGVIKDAVQREELSAAVLRTLTSRAESQGTRFVQAAIDPTRDDQIAALSTAGFQSIARLRTLQRPLDEPLKRTAVPHGTLVPFDAANEGRFSHVVQRTYQDSLDCPSFGGLRSASEAMHSYRFAGEFTPRRWRLVEDQGADVAVIIVNDQVAERSREIVYLGVVPEARRHGLARWLLEDAIAEAISDGCDSVMTSVDAANDKALALYSRTGFVPLYERDIFIWQPKTKPQ